MSDSTTQYRHSAIGNSLAGVTAAIPAYNEGARIASVVHGCLASGAEVWVIDDGSSDDTSARASEAGAKVIRHARNLGKGMAIRTALDAFARSTGRFLVFMDADGQHDPAHLGAFVETACRTDAVLVVGNRMRSAGEMPLVRRWTNRLLSRIVSHLARQKIPDSQCGYRLVTREFAARFKPTTAHFDLESEMLIQAGRLGMRIESAPISTLYQGQASHIHPLRDTWRFLKLLARYLRS
ncbi:MAG: glycosyltransferase family 2 protein [Verrucomicrobia bacterium]|nr:glycosyltransferase family 2 protein [Verrucomicrobiota bacterium]